MKKIGLIGGISWTSTIDYYRFINEEVNNRLGDLNFAECIVYSLNFNDFHKCNSAYDWEGSYRLLLDAAVSLKRAGADLIVLGANTAHIVADRVAESCGLPLVDIRTATAMAIKKANLQQVALLGTAYTMELDFYKSTLTGFGIACITPKNKAHIDFIEQTLLYELGRGMLLPRTKAEYLRIANALIDEGAQGIILGCTEIPLILSQEDFDIPVFNTTQIHVKAAVEMAMGNNW
jgi:aspartate racemase